MKKSLILSILGLILINLPAFADASLGGGEEPNLESNGVIRRGILTNADI